jgi:hypothetical chaperone protein
MNDRDVPSVFAIDFGTSNSLLAAASASRVFAPAPIDPEASDPTVLKSALYFMSLEEASFGASATRALVENGFRGRLIRSIKRHLPSRSFSKTQIGSRQLSLEDLVGAFLRVMRTRACKHFGADVTAVVMGRPARFSSNDEDDALAEERLRKAAGLAGFTSVTFCPEPIAAAYDFAADLSEKRVVMIADLGGGTSDFTIVRMERNGFDAKDVLATHGLSVAGDAMDGALMRRVGAPHFGSRAQYTVPFGHNDLTMPRKLIELLASPADLTLVDRKKVLGELTMIKEGLIRKDDRPMLERFVALVEDGLGFPLYEAIEAGKRGLSDAERCTITVTDPSIAFEESIDRALLESTTANEVEAIVGSMRQTLEKAGIAAEEVEILCLTGGTSRMPLLMKALAAELPNAKARRLSSFHSVVLGLAKRAQEVAATLS